MTAFVCGLPEKNGFVIREKQKSLEFFMFSLEKFLKFYYILYRKSLEFSKREV